MFGLERFCVTQGLDSPAQMYIGWSEESKGCVDLFLLQRGLDSPDGWTAHENFLLRKTILLSGTVMPLRTPRLIRS